MMQNNSKAHPYMPSSAGAAQQEMLSAIGRKNTQQLFDQIPEHHRISTPLTLPHQLNSEVELKRHLLSVLKKNSDCETNLNFLGAGCWQHHVPSICDEISGRTEFLTNVWGTPSSDHGRNQAFFEFSSQLGELLKLDMVGLPVYSYGCAAGHAIRMSARITGRREVLVPTIIDPERLAVIKNYCEPPDMSNHIRIQWLKYDQRTGLVDLDDLEEKLSDQVAAVYFEVPSYFGLVEENGKAISQLAASYGVETIVGCDPISLGILKSPVDYGADIVVGPVQPLGIHMNCGGGVSGFIASRDQKRYVREYNTLNISITDTADDGQYGFGLSCAGQTSYGLREDGNDWTGNSTYLWAIAGAVYMGLLGPTGFREVGELIVQQSNYAANILSKIEGLSILFDRNIFKEFVLNFDQTEHSVEEVNNKLRERNIFGGKDLSVEFPEFGQSALYCVTEIHNAQDISFLADQLQEVLFS